MISPAADQSLFNLLTILRPLGISDLPTLFAHTGRALSVEIQGQDDLRLRGVVARHGQGGVLSLSFGIALLSAIKRYRLTLQDFAPTDLAPEMLYLIEANQAAMSASRSLTERLQGAKMLAEEQAHSDTLTGLRNRRSLERILDHLAQTDESFSLIQIDLDYFKSVNDTLGHAAGDTILQHVANVLRRETRHDDFLIRMGGDEFLLVIKHMTDHARLMSLSTALIRGIEDPKSMMERPVKFRQALVFWSMWAAPFGRRQMCYIVWMKRFMPQNMGGGDRRISRPEGGA